MPDNVVDVQNLSRSFGKQLVLDDVSVTLPRGYVCGLVGANGQGKTTLIKHLLGLLSAQQGRVSVFGLDPVRHPVDVLSRIGYLSEQRDLPEWMRIGELMRYTAAFHPGWDGDYAQELLETFRLDPSKRIKELSKGMRAQVGLIAAVAHRPELLLLDEPSTGLDAVVRRDILNAIVRTVADEGRTVLFSSHLLDEVEQMSDRVIMIDAGRVVLQGPLDEIQEQHQRWVVRFPGGRDSLPALDEVVSAERNGMDWVIVLRGSGDHSHAVLTAAGGQILQSRCASLQDTFLAFGGRRTRPEHLVDSLAGVAE